MKYRIIFILTLLLLLPSLAEAQCAMCRAVLESEGSQSTAKGINDGILFLMVFPYILMGGIGYFIYRMFKKKKTTE
ncbi:hypothetical protein L1I30_00660 [Gillisia sp. M10.2A]|uniref:Uncharacterized protein n=1 Tax=Gillisia lutea TaxID=2909668 RepID=A0ABS9EBA5_9FLAO|nr:hypothetical protein [Gillisia lutea]MCF4100165.1 hypothetical protein [Gillisia lutea]